MVVGADGAVNDSAVYRALVLNRAKLAYNSVAAWLDGTAPPPPPLAAVRGLDELMRVQDRVAQVMKNRRHQQGALSLETIQTRALFNGDVLADLLPDEKNRAKELIEDFMIAANGVTAKSTSRARAVTVAAPDSPHARGAGIASWRSRRRCGGASRPGGRGRAREGFLIKRQRADALRFPDLALSVVKLLGSGEYAVQRPGHTPDGHFGLAVRDYTHSTAPNRRFPDLITQRLLKSALAGRPTAYSDAELDSLARHCTEQEDNAAKVERQVGNPPPRCCCPRGSASGSTRW
jgi:exoribonuclease-2